MNENKTKYWHQTVLSGNRPVSARNESYCDEGVRDTASDTRDDFTECW